MNSMTEPHTANAITELLEGIYKELRRTNTSYMTVKDIAEEFGVSESTVRNEWIVAPGFPKKHYFPTKREGDGKSRPYYKRKDLEAYLERVNR